MKQKRVNVIIGWFPVLTKAQEAYLRELLLSDSTAKHAAAAEWLLRNKIDTKTLFSQFQLEDLCHYPRWKWVEMPQKLAKQNRNFKRLFRRMKFLTDLMAADTTQQETPKFNRFENLPDDQTDT